MVFTVKKCTKNKIEYNNKGNKNAMIYTVKIIQNNA